MRTTMRMQDLKEKNGFPTDIDRSRPVVVVTGEEKSQFDIVCYYDKKGKPKFEYIIVDDVRQIFAPGMYILNPK